MQVHAWLKAGWTDTVAKPTRTTRSNTEKEKNVDKLEFLTIKFRFFKWISSKLFELQYDYLQDRVRGVAKSKKSEWDAGLVRIGKQKKIVQRSFRSHATEEWLHMVDGVLQSFELQRRGTKSDAHKVKKFKLKINWRLQFEVICPTDFFADSSPLVVACRWSKRQNSRASCSRWQRGWSGTGPPADSRWKPGSKVDQGNLESNRKLNSGNFAQIDIRTNDFGTSTLPT